MGICSIGSDHEMDSSRPSRRRKPTRLELDPHIKRIIRQNLKVYDFFQYQKTEKLSLIKKNPLSSLSLSFLSKMTTTKLQSYSNLKYLRNLDIIISFENFSGANMLSFKRLSAHQNRLKQLYLNFWKISSADNKKFVQIVTSLSTLVNLEVLIITFKGPVIATGSKITDKSLLALSSALSKLSRLKKFSLDLYSCHSITDIGFVCFSNAVGKLFKLEELYLDMHLVMMVPNFEGNKGVTDVGICSLSQNLSRLKKLKTLALNINSMLKLTSITLKSFCATIPKLKDLEFIHFEIPIWERVNNQELSAFFDALTEAKHLKKLNIRFGYKTEITEVNLPHLSEWLKKLQNLEHVTIPLANSCSTRAIEELTNAEDNNRNEIENLLPPSNIKSLELLEYSVATQSEVSYLSSLCKYIKELPKLVILKLNFVHSRIITNSSIVELGESLQHFKTLRQLDVVLSFRNLSEKSAYSFIKAIPECKKLRELKMQIYLAQNLESTVILAFTEALSHLKKLRVFHFGLPDFNWKDLFDSDFVQFCKALSGLGHLKDLFVDLNRTSMMSEDVFLSLGQALAFFHRLKYLRLIFSFCEKASDRALICLSEGIRKLKNLKTLELNFANSGVPSLFRKTISDKGLIIFSRALLDIKPLSDLKLNFRSSDLDDSGLKVLSKALKRLKHLRRLQLDFLECHKITNVGISYFREMYPLLNQLNFPHILDHPFAEGFVIDNPTKSNPLN